MYFVDAFEKIAVSKKWIADRVIGGMRSRIHVGRIIEKLPGGYLNEKQYKGTQHVQEYGSKIGDYLAKKLKSGDKIDRELGRRYLSEVAAAHLKKRGRAQ